MGEMASISFDGHKRGTLALVEVARGAYARLCHTTKAVTNGQSQGGLRK